MGSYIAPTNIHSIPFTDLQDAQQQLSEGLYVPLSGYVNLVFINGMGISYYSMHEQAFIELDDDNFLDGFKWFVSTLSGSEIVVEGNDVVLISPSGRETRFKRFIYDSLRNSIKSIHESNMPL